MRTPDADPNAHASTGAHDANNPIWAGYVVTGSDFTMVQGSWIVHGVDCDQTPNANSSEWVGLDGYSDSVITSPTVEQTGTDADCANGTPLYYVWYEFFPDGPAVVPADIVSIKAGDVFSASIAYNGDNQYSVIIGNNTTGEVFTHTGTFIGAAHSGLPARNTAEWILERDGTPNFADFVTDPFGPRYTSAWPNIATDSSHSYAPINAFDTKIRADMTSQSPSDLASDGESFQVFYQSPQGPAGDGGSHKKDPTSPINQCNPGDKQCIDGDQFQQCNDNGDGTGSWSGGYSCGASWPGTTCSAGYCVGSPPTSQCNPGDKQCIDGDQFQQCNDNGDGTGSWSGGYSCGASWPGTTCSAGYCVGSSSDSGGGCNTDCEDDNDGGCYDAAGCGGDCAGAIGNGNCSGDYYSY